jgi:hypothetical protein
MKSPLRRGRHAAFAAWRAGRGVPVGSGDVTHHLLLVDYIERNWRLCTIRASSHLGEMVHYTPGLHIWRRSPADGSAPTGSRFGRWFR